MTKQKQVAIVKNLKKIQKQSANNAFPLLVATEFATKINPDDPLDPLLLQILPRAQEQKKHVGFLHDPLGEKQAQPIPGLLHKYHGRVLLLVTKNCPLNCRFCFRRNMSDVITNWPGVFKYIAADPTIKEVILSGGDPLMLANNQLLVIIKQLAKIPHVNILRIHTRVPVAMPKRINNKLIASLANSRLKTVVVVHINHPQEIDALVSAAIARLRKKDILLLNQSVLLKGINASAPILIALSEKLFSIGVLPYYLHLLDKVQGAGHFFVSNKQAQKIYRAISEQLPGFLVPKMVYEQPGAKAKIMLNADKQYPRL